MVAPTESGWTYAKAGVDRSLVGRSLGALLGAVRYRPPPSHGRLVDLPGHYAGLVRIGRETIAVTTDTVGTKSLLAEQVGSWEEVGQDLVAVNANDLAAVGARPSVLVDCISCAQPSPKVFEAIGRGLDRGLREAGMALIGGETAVVPDVVRGYDLGGTAVGFFPRGRRPVTGDRIRPGDVVLGVPSSGLHANGFTLVRRLLDEKKVDLLRPRPGAKAPVGLELLRATRLYPPVSETLADAAETTGFAHISGGGVRNLVRLNEKVAFVLDHWPEPAGVFGWLGTLGALTTTELYQTFNMGVGFVVVTRPLRLAQTMRRLARAGAPDAFVVGHIERGHGVRLPHLGLEYEGYGG
jgi:phosphoribosylformylglycinamidine cyclo-ligase